VLQSFLEKDDKEEKITPISYSHLPKPTIITLYLLPDSIHFIEPILITLLNRIPQLIVVCNTWGFQSREATQIKYAVDSETGFEVKLYLYAHNCGT